MYLHIGNGKTIKKKDIIGIFDLDSATVSSVSKRFIKNMEKRGRLVYEDDDLPRAFVICGKGEKSVMYLSRISPAGLRTRSEASLSDEI